MKHKKERDSKKGAGIITGIKLVAAILSATCIVGWMINTPKLPFIGGTEEGWLGYWGSIIGIVGAYTILRIQLKGSL